MLIGIVGWILLRLSYGGQVGVARALEASATATLIPTTSNVASTEIGVKENITEPRSKEAGYRLESVLEKQGLKRWNGLNTARVLVRMAVNKGVSANTIVLLLLLPVIATLVSFLHYVIGISGYGIFMPTMIGVTFLATGIFGGLMLFAMILAMSLLSNMVLRRFRLHFWPARSINLLFISLGTFGLMFLSSVVRVLDIRDVSIFSVLLMILLAEEFVRTQLIKSKSEAKRLTLGTLVLAMSGAVAMNIREVQEWVLLNPGVVVLMVLGINLWIGSYRGIRLMEIKRFRKAIREKR